MNCSKWEQMRTKAIVLRKRGKSLPELEKELGIPRSTLSGWLKNVNIAERYRVALDRRWRQGLVKARQLAAKRHTELKDQRIAAVQESVREWFSKVPKQDDVILEIALAMLYLGEGSKTRSGLGLGNSDPMIVRFYAQSLQKLYGITPDRLRVELHLRDDQDEKKLMKFWSEQTGLPLNRFVYVVKDTRTIGKPTYERYKGVCTVTGGGVEIQRRLMYLAEVFCKNR